MPFTHPAPDWNAQGAEPPESLRTNGWQINQKPPADYFNWFFYNSAKAIIELQLEAINIDQKGVPDGLATLGADGKVPASQLNVSAPPDASTTVKGVVQLSNSTTSTSEELAATPKAVKDAKDGLSAQIGILSDKVDDLKTIKSNKDANGIFTTLTYRRKSDDSLFATSVLSGGTSPKYTTRTVTYYEPNGTTVRKTVTYTLTYDTDGSLVSEV
ncbi:phage tail protein [Exiguobacterium profundum]|uniref:phage tail protein n=1 Tax=Exiguobacterium profundum TaxID=307643 RepID=UPI0029C2F97D|nr:phage tail protein [Exiguobacterium profundum]MDX5982274.1 phage tail protein [Exiguobacterium profundum]